MNFVVHLHRLQANTSDSPARTTFAPDRENRGRVTPVTLREHPSALSDTQAVSSTTQENG